MNYIKNKSKLIILAAVAVIAFGLMSQAFAGACDPNSGDPIEAACADLYTIEGQKFNDLNNNGINDSEPGLSGWTITITDGGSFSDSTTTDVNGDYSFEDLEAGTYTVCEVAQANWTQTVPVINNGCYEITLAQRLLHSPSCLLMDKTGRTVVEFGTNVIRSDLAEMFSYVGPISTSITAGIYDLMFLSYDNNHPFEGDQPQEQWYTVLKNQLGQNIVLTNPVSDLPSSSKWLSQRVRPESYQH